MEPLDLVFFKNLILEKIKQTNENVENIEKTRETKEMILPKIDLPTLYTWLITEQMLWKERSRYCWLNAAEII